MLPNFNLIEWATVGWRRRSPEGDVDPPRQALTLEVGDSLPTRDAGSGVGVDDGDVGLGRRSRNCARDRDRIDAHLRAEQALVIRHLVAMTAATLCLLPWLCLRTPLAFGHVRVANQSHLAGDGVALPNVHGSPPHSSTWQSWEHGLLATMVWVLGVKVLLAEAQRYDLNDADRWAIEALVARIAGGSPIKDRWRKAAEEARWTVCGRQVEERLRQAEGPRC